MYHSFGRRRRNFSPLPRLVVVVSRRFSLRHSRGRALHHILSVCLPLTPFQPYMNELQFAPCIFIMPMPAETDTTNMWPHITCMSVCALTPLTTALVAAPRTIFARGTHGDGTHSRSHSRDRPRKMCELLTHTHTRARRILLVVLMLPPSSKGGRRGTCFCLCGFSFAISARCAVSWPTATL